MAKAQDSLFRLAAPLIVSFLMRSLFTFVDTIYASTLGDAAIAAIGLAIPLEFVFIAIWVGLSNSFTSYFSKAMGKNDDAGCDLYYRKTTEIIGVLIPLFLLMAVGIYFVAPHLGLEAEVAEGFQIYASVLVGGSALVGFWSVLPDSIVKAHHDTRSTMIAGILSNVLNLVLNTFFLFVLNWGLFGIAFSTVIGRFGGLAYALYRASLLEKERRTETAAAPRAMSVPIARPIRQLLALGVPASVAYVLMATEGGLVNYFLAEMDHATAAIAAYSIFHRFFLFSLMPVIATTVALLPFVARHSGAGSIQLIRANFAQALLVSFGYCFVVLGPICIFAAEPVLRFLAEEPETVRFGVFALQLVPFVSLASVPFLLARPLFEGLQRGRPSVIMALLRYVLLAPPLAYAGMVIGPRYGWSEFHGLMLGLMVATALVSGIFLVWAWRFLGMLQHEAQDSREMLAARAAQSAATPAG